MSKSTNFSGQPILSQLLFYIRGVNINRIAKKYDAEHYVKRFDTHQHLIVMLFGTTRRIIFITERELVIEILSNAYKHIPSVKK